MGWFHQEGYAESNKVYTNLAGPLCRSAFPLVGFVCTLIAGCSSLSLVENNGDTGPSSTMDSNTLPITEGDWYQPGVSTTWQWQLQPDASGNIDISYDVDVYDLDLFETAVSTIQKLHSQGRAVVCYFSAGTYEDFREDSGRFLSVDLGNMLEDFADERWLDIRSTDVRDIMLDRLDLAVQKGCDGVEPDNVDAFANDSGFNLTSVDQLAYNRFLANEAHQRGLSVGLKNDLGQIAELVEYFDFSVNEQCHEYGECDRLLPFIDAGKPVYNAEYADAYVNSVGEREAVCAASQNLGLQTLFLPIELDDSFRFACTH